MGRKTDRETAEETATRTGKYGAVWMECFHQPERRKWDKFDMVNGVEGDSIPPICIMGKSNDYSYELAHRITYLLKLADGIPTRDFHDGRISVIRSGRRGG